MVRRLAREDAVAAKSSKLTFPSLSSLPFFRLSFISIEGEGEEDEGIVIEGGTGDGMVSESEGKGNGIR